MLPHHPFQPARTRRCSAPARYGPAKQAQHTKDQRHVDRHQEAVQNLVGGMLLMSVRNGGITTPTNHTPRGCSGFQDHINDPLRLIDVARIECLHKRNRGMREHPGHREDGSATSVHFSQPNINFQPSNSRRQLQARHINSDNSVEILTTWPIAPGKPHSDNPLVRPVVGRATCAPSASGTALSTVR